jgi:hypothetical protein
VLLELYFGKFEFSKVPQESIDYFDIAHRDVSNEMAPEMLWQATAHRIHVLTGSWLNGDFP